METATLPSAPFPSVDSVAASSASFLSNPSTLQSPSEQYFLSNGISCDLRSDGRSRVDYRYFQLRSGVVAHCAGSARMQLEGTDVIVAVTADITPTDWSRPDDGVLVCSVELAASLSAVGGPSSLLVPIELKAALDSLFVRSRSFDTAQLCILRGEQCWTLYIDVLVLSMDGNLLDAAALATKAALVDTKLPAVAVSTTNGNSQQPIEVTLTDEPPTRLQSTHTVPVCVSLHSFNGSSHFVLDCRAEEEAAAEWRLAVGVCEDGRIVSIEKGGRRAATQPMIAKMMAAALKVGVDLNRMVSKLSRPMEDSSSSEQSDNSSSGRADMQIH